MASFRFYLLSAVICSVLVVGQATSPTTPPTQTIPVKKIEITAPETTLRPEPTAKPDTTTPPTTTSTTPITTTSTTPSTTTSTTPSTTTSTTPSTTTSTTPSTTTSTTPSTTTSTTPSTTTSTTTQAPPSPTPKPVPAPAMGTWKYVDEKNVTCIVVQFAAQLNVTYPMANVSTLGIQLVNVPPVNATVVSGWCGVTNQSLTISWPATVDKNNTLAILFEKNDTTKSYELKSLNVTLVPSIFPNISNVDAIDLYHGMEWQTPLATSYRCATPTKLTLTTAEPVNVAATMTLSQLQEEAFRTATGSEFSAARDCAGGDIPDAVPIAVGCALGGMVVVVLIAYLVARRRSAARGYLSM